MSENKRRTKTSTAAKQRYIDKTYRQFSVKLRRDDFDEINEFLSVKGWSRSDFVKKAYEEIKNAERLQYIEHCIYRNYQWFIDHAKEFNDNAYYVAVNLFLECCHENKQVFFQQNTSKEAIGALYNLSLTCLFVARGTLDVNKKLDCEIVEDLKEIFTLNSLNL